VKYPAAAAGPEGLWPGGSCGASNSLKNFPPPCWGRIKVGVIIRSFPPHPYPLPPGERVSHSSPQQSWRVFWHILIKWGHIPPFMKHTKRDVSPFTGLP